MKVAQLSATIPDLLPEEYARKLAELQSNAPYVMGVCQKKNESRAWENWQDIFYLLIKRQVSPHH